MGLDFKDTDLDIQVAAGATLQTILEQYGYEHLRNIEEQVLLKIFLPGAVIATGGSVVYSSAAMKRLQAAGPVIYLKTDLVTLQHRVNNAPHRGIANGPGMTLTDVFNERTPLYERYATRVIDVSTGNPDQIASRILQA